MNFSVHHLENLSSNAKFKVDGQDETSDHLDRPQF